MGVLTISMCLFICIGYAAVSDILSITGSVNVDPPELPDVYITNITPSQDAGVTINDTNGTIMFASVNGSGSATFTIEVINISDTAYVFDRVMSGFEMGFHDAYPGTDITYELSGISQLDKIEPNGKKISFNITITVPRGVTAQNYILNYNFVKYAGTDILPGNDEYDITFQYNNGQPDTKIKVHENEFVPRPETPYRNGYTFIGWYTDPSLTTAWNFDIDRVTKPLTLYAGWEKNAPTQYSVIFRPNNGDGDRTIFVSAGSLISPQTSPVMEGYTFIGWYTDSACTIPWNFDTDKVNSNIILYGGWEIYVPPVPPDCNITFKPNNGEPDATIIVLTGEFIPRPSTPVREGYVFTGWYTDEACTNAWNFEVDKVQDHTVLYGGWEIEHIVESVKYTINFKPNNGGADSSVIVESGNLIPRPETPTRSGYTFVGWYTDSGCTSGWNFDTDFPSSDMTLYAGWEKTTSSSDDNGYHNDFLGLVEALHVRLDGGDEIFNAVMNSLNSQKRKDAAPIVHCEVKSVPGGNMAKLASEVNKKLTANLHFVFEADPDPAYQETRLRLYMYYYEELVDAKDGEEIMVYRQIFSLSDDGDWYPDGTYVGWAVVGNFFAGGNDGGKKRTINTYTWRLSNTVAE